MNIRSSVRPVTSAVTQITKSASAESVKRQNYYLNRKISSDNIVKQGFTNKKVADNTIRKPPQLHTLKNLSPSNTIHAKKFTSIEAQTSGIFKGQDSILAKESLVTSKKIEFLPKDDGAPINFIMLPRPGTLIVRDQYPLMALNKSVELQQKAEKLNTSSSNLAEVKSSASVPLKMELFQGSNSYYNVVSQILKMQSELSNLSLDQILTKHRDNTNQLLLSSPRKGSSESQSDSQNESKYGWLISAVVTSVVSSLIVDQLAPSDDVNTSTVNKFTKELNKELIEEIYQVFITVLERENANLILEANKALEFCEGDDEQQLITAQLEDSLALNNHSIEKYKSVIEELNNENMGLESNAISSTSQLGVDAARGAFEAILEKSGMKAAAAIPVLGAAFSAGICVYLSDNFTKEEVEERFLDMFKQFAPENDQNLSLQNAAVASKLIGLDAGISIANGHLIDRVGDKLAGTVSKIKAYVPGCLKSATVHAMAKSLPGAIFLRFISDELSPFMQTSQLKQSYEGGLLRNMIDVNKKILQTGIESEVNKDIENSRETVALFHQIVEEQKIAKLAAQNQKQIFQTEEKTTSYFQRIFPFLQ